MLLSINLNLFEKSFYYKVLIIKIHHIIDFNYDSFGSMKADIRMF